MREAGIDVRDVPKIHVDKPQVENPSLYFPDEKVRIMLSLDGIFSYFPTSKPSVKDLEECENVLSLTPSGPWDPNTKVYAQNEQNMTDHEGDMIEEKHRVQILLSDIHEDVSLNNEHQISDVEARMVDTNFEGIDLTPKPSEHKTIDVYQLEALMAMQNADAQFMKPIVSTTVC